MRYAHYPSDLTDRQWNFIKHELPLPRRGGRPRSTNIRRVLNAILYLHHSGCPWRYLPRSYPPWKTVYDYFCKWSHAGVWIKVVHSLHAFVRLRMHKTALPTLGIIDSQSVKAHRGEDIGRDGFKKVKGRRRHILVDVLGIILGCKVRAANISDPDGGIEILERLPPEIEHKLKKILGDGQYSARFMANCVLLHHIDVETTRDQTNKRIGFMKPKELLKMPKRWIVERTFAWFNNYRRLTRDYEERVLHSESMLFIAMIPILLHRLTS
ncbi:MAG: IS5 family transposase [Pseudobdellovibrionaceae bacterium]